MISLAVIALLTLASAAVAMALRNLIHSALLLVASWAGIAAFYLWAGAEFVAFAQVLVYVGAVSMVVLFAVLLTRQPDPEQAVGLDLLRRTAAALLAGGAVFGVLCGAVVSTDIQLGSAAGPSLSTRQIGTELMSTHAVALLIVGALLSVALLGAVVIAATEGTAAAFGRNPQDAAGDGRGPG